MIRVVVADDHTILREGLKQLLLAAGDIDIVGEAGDGHEVLRLAREADFDVLLLDMSMPGKSGTELIKQVKAERPRLRVLVLSMHEEHQYAVRAIKAGASGYLTKESASAQLVLAIRKVARAARSSAPKSPSSSRWARCRTPKARRTPRCRIASIRCSSGWSPAFPSRTSRRELNLSGKTVSTHKARLMEKLGVTNPAELIRYALRHRLSGDPEMPG